MNRSKVLTAMLSLCVGAASLPASAVAFTLPETAASVQKEDRPTSGTCGEDLTWVFDETTGTLTISGTGEMDAYDYSVTRPWDLLEYTSAVIEDGVTSIGANAFSQCTSLTSVTIPDTVTTIQFSAFDHCSSLRSITFPPNIENIEYSLCCGCTALSSVTFPDGLRFISDSAFENCTSLTSVTIPGEVLSVGINAFAGCTSLTSVTIPEDAADLSIQGRAFYKTPWLEAKFEEDPSWIWQHTLEAVDEDLKGEYVVAPDIAAIEQYAFKDCIGLTSVIFPETTDASRGISLDVRSFEGCTGLTTVVLPSSVGFVGNMAFKDSGLTSVTVYAKEIGPMGFGYCPALTSITFEDPDCEIYDSAETICNTHDILSDTSTFTGTICGYENSTAQAYAEKYGYKFELLEKAETTQDMADVNGDGEISVDDSSVLLQDISIQLFGDSQFTDAQFKAADVNGDGSLTVDDATIILRYLAAKLFDTSVQITDFI